MAVKGGIKKGVDVYFFFSENILWKKEEMNVLAHDQILFLFIPAHKKNAKK